MNSFQRRKPDPWTLAWLAWLALFLVVEIPGFVTKSGKSLKGTLSEHIPIWFPNKLRFLLLAQFFPCLLIHFWGMLAVAQGEPGHWFYSWKFIASSGAVMVSSIVYAEGWERRRVRIEGRQVLKTRFFEMLAKLFLGGIFRDVAEGKKGEKLKAIYWKIAGKKTITGAIIGLAWAATLYFDPQLGSELETPILTVVGLLVGWGLVDKSWRAGVPLPEWAPVFSKILSYGPAASAIVALVVEYLPKIPNCSFCDVAAVKVQIVAGGVAAATAWLAARFTEPPTIG